MSFHDDEIEENDRPAAAEAVLQSRPARPVALVTGASGGIGAAFSRRLAADHDVVLVARSRERLEALRSELHDAHPAGRFEVVVADLSGSGNPQAVIDEVRRRDLEVDLLVNNAGSGHHGPFVEQPPEQAVAQVALDCAAVVALARGVLPGMLARRRGAIVNVASTAAFQPVPTMAVYGASKAFVLSFSEALHVEMQGAGVEVLALCPGGTQTGFFTAAGSEFMTGRRQTADEVVTTALRALERRKATVVSGRLNKLSSTGYRFLPRKLIAWGSGWIVRAR